MHTVCTMQGEQSLTAQRWHHEDLSVRDQEEWAHIALMVHDQWNGNVPPVGGEVFRRILAAFPTGLAIVTSRTQSGQNVGLTANAIASVSLNPPLLLVCLDKRTFTLETIRKSRVFGINFLEGGQELLATKFASRRTDKFDGVSHHMGQLGVPVLEGCLATAECTVNDLVDAGDHVVVIGRIVHGETDLGRPLMYFRQEFATWPSRNDGATPQAQTA